MYSGYNLIRDLKGMIKLKEFIKLAGVELDDLKIH